MHQFLILSVTLTLLIGCNEPDNTNQPDDPLAGDTLTGSITLSGTIFIDTSAKTEPNQQSLSPTQPLSNATVALVQRFNNGDEQVINTVLSNANGQYQFNQVPAAITGTGSDDDYYYELQSSRDAYRLSAPTAPITDTLINITPSTNLAVLILSSVVNVPGLNDEPLPSNNAIENMRKLVSQNVETLSQSINIPNTNTTNAEQTRLTANAITTAGGNAEHMLKAYQFHAEWLAFNANINASIDQATAYVKRINREACGQQPINVMPLITAQALAQAILDKQTFTLDEILSAYKNQTENHPELGNNAELTTATALSLYNNVLSKIQLNLSNTTTLSDLNSLQQLVFYTQRQLSAPLSLDSSLAPDQTVTFLQLLFAKRQTNQLCKMPLTALTAMIHELTNNTRLLTAHIADLQIYHNSGFGCPPDQGHFRAEINVYAPNRTITKVTINSSDTAALDGTGNMILQPDGDHYQSNINNICVSHNKTVTYTINVELDDGTTLTETRTRNHSKIPEAQAQYNNLPLSTDANNPTRITHLRPTLTWQSQKKPQTSIPNAPLRSQIKYTYEFAHVDLTDFPISPLAQCGTTQIDTTQSSVLYAVDSFIPTVACDPNACAIATDKNSANLACRINIQTYLLDPADQLLGQATGNFTYFCVDSNNDSVCGD